MARGIGLFSLLVGKGWDGKEVHRVVGLIGACIRAIEVYVDR